MTAGNPWGEPLHVRDRALDSDGPAFTHKPHRRGGLFGAMAAPWGSLKSLRHDPRFLSRGGSHNRGLKIATNHVRLIPEPLFWGSPKI